ncbi:Hypothetical_protein [Hexamita inflata]|uniref:Hypothetical_protein n=1 Tax=Hexamita inflata TaxID=28002 RepID=A0AA86R526_9EUKA|nr:Hypothetical protein HINF_LOCUS59509 [Hexamita inflata]
MRKTQQLQYPRISRANRTLDAEKSDTPSARYRAQKNSITASNSDLLTACTPLKHHFATDLTALYSDYLKPAAVGNVIPHRDIATLHSFIQLLESIAIQFALIYYHFFMASLESVAVFTKIQNISYAFGVKYQYFILVYTIQNFSVQQIKQYFKTKIRNSFFSRLEQELSINNLQNVVKQQLFQLVIFIQLIMSSRHKLSIYWSPYTTGLLWNSFSLSFGVRVTSIDAIYGVMSSFYLFITFRCIVGQQHDSLNRLLNRLLLYGTNFNPIFNFTQHNAVVVLCTLT